MVLQVQLLYLERVDWAGVADRLLPQHDPSPAVVPIPLVQPQVAVRVNLQTK